MSGTHLGIGAGAVPSPRRIEGKTMFRIVVRYKTGTTLELKKEYPTRDAAEAEGVRKYAGKKNLSWHTTEIDYTSVNGIPTKRRK